MLPKVQLTLTRFLVSSVVAVLVVKKAMLTSSISFESATLQVSVASATLMLHVSVASATLKLHVSIASAARWLYELC